MRTRQCPKKTTRNKKVQSTTDRGKKTKIRRRARKTATTETTINYSDQTTNKHSSRQAANQQQTRSKQAANKQQTSSKQSANEQPTSRTTNEQQTSSKPAANEQQQTRTDNQQTSHKPANEQQTSRRQAADKQQRSSSNSNSSTGHLMAIIVFVKWIQRGENFLNSSNVQKQRNRHSTSKVPGRFAF